MDLQIAGTNIEITPEAQRYVEKKLGKINKHIPDIIDTKVEISEEKTKSPQEHYLVRVTVNSGVGGAVFHGEERAEDLFKAVDKVVAVVSRQMEKHKGKLYDKGRGNPLARGKYNHAEQAETEKKVVKTKRFIIEPMSLDEAIERMEELGHNFFLFFDPDADEVRLLYRRNDGNYGIIEPELR
ncbi:MAG: ribosome-associated translation inhibitor RaiA [Dehalococcoidales bacterium]|nr:ribosome-associated translation inhibitor RaiA [Dehalococcoidales bacterium]